MVLEEKQGSSPEGDKVLLNTGGFSFVQAEALKRVDLRLIILWCKGQVSRTDLRPLRALIKPLRAVLGPVRAYQA